MPPRSPLVVRKLHLCRLGSTMYRKKSEHPKGHFPEINWSVWNIFTLRLLINTRNYFCPFRLFEAGKIQVIVLHGYVLTKWLIYVLTREHTVVKLVKWPLEIMTNSNICWCNVFSNCYLQSMITKCLNLTFRNLPNKGAGRSSKVRSDRLRERLRFSAFQRWFRIENRTIIKETMPILVI